MAGYHNDQYFNLDTIGGENFGDSPNANTTVGYSVIAADNPGFTYPDRTIRTGAADGAVTYLKRGYIRSIITYANRSKLDIRKCQFQFNPSTLVQSVSSNDSMLNFLQQDPEQYAQPMPANVNFTFDLFFDRSMEINNDKGNLITNDVNPWEQGDPGQVGVLRDIGAFYGVIGQGLSTHQIGYLQQVLKEQVTTEAKNLTTTETPVSPDKAVNNIPKFLDNNIGNSGFLLPLPVRIVFSSLYIVEGLVTNTTVQFTKFSSAMVPMQCSLNVTVDAKYVGFAKKNTFFTAVLADRELKERVDSAAAIARVQSAYTAFSAMANVMHLEIDTEANGVSGIVSSLPTAAALPNDNQDNVVGMYTAGDTMTASVQASITVYGPYGNNVLMLLPTESALKSFALTNISLLGTNTPWFDGTLLPSTATNGQATTADEWKKMAKGATSAGVSLHAAVSGVDLDTSYFIARYTGSCTVVLDGQTIVGQGEKWIRTDKGDIGVSKGISINLSWPTYVAAQDSVSGVVPPDNGAIITNPAPGASSTVGAPPPVTSGHPGVQ